MARPVDSRLIAAGGALLAAIALVLMLMLCGLTQDPDALAQATPAVPPDTDVQYIDPELLDPPAPDGTDPADDVPEQPAQQPLGLEQQAPEVSKEKIVDGKNPQPAVSTEKLVTQKQPSPVKTTEPAPAKKPESNIASSMGSKFNGKNGSPTGSQGGYATGGKGTGVNGKLSGRKFLGCDMPQVRLRAKYTVVIRVEVNAQGKVISASVSSAGGAPRDVQDKCLAAARTARWSAKEGASNARGSLSFTLVPNI